MIDYENLGNYLIKEHPEVALYAYDIRGQGFDPVRERRGDIDAPDNWYRDLHTFTELVRKNHPRAKIVWQGESMGSLILSNAYLNDALTGKNLPAMRSCSARRLSECAAISPNGKEPRFTVWEWFSPVRGFP